MFDRDQASVGVGIGVAYPRRPDRAADADPVWCADDRERHRAADLGKCGRRAQGPIIPAAPFGATAQTPSTSIAEPDLTPIVDLVFSYHGVADTLRRAGDHIDKALEALAAFPESIARDALHSAAEFTVARER